MVEISSVVPSWTPLAQKGTRGFPPRVTVRATARRTRRFSSFPVAASRGFANPARGSRSDDGKTYGDESRPGASRLFDEARGSKGTKGTDPSQNHGKVHAVATHARVALASPNVVPAAAAAAAAAAGAFLLQRKKKRANLNARDPSSSPLVPAATASGEAAWTDPGASPAPRLDIAGDAFSSFAAGGDVKANEANAARLEKNMLEAELADLELDLAAFEAALKSGGKALRRATSATSAEGSARNGTETTSRDPRIASRTNATTKTTDGRAEVNERLATSSKVSTFSKVASPPDLPPSASTAWWDVDIDERAYRPSTTRKMKDSESKDAEKRRESRKQQRARYFRTNISVRAASVLVARRAEQDLLTRLAPSSPLDARVFDSRVIGPAAYGVALAALCKEQNLGDVRGEGTFSDVYATEPAIGDSNSKQTKLGDWSFAGDAAPGFDAEPPRFCAAEESTSGTYARAVIKCSVPFPGVVNGRLVGDGLRIGETEARVLAFLPRHENVVRLLAAFLSEERNESYLLLQDAGQNLHAMRERGEVSPKDVRRHARVVLEALAHCHKNGVVHRDVKGGNVLVAEDDTLSGAGNYPRATLIDFGVARHHSVTDTEPASRYGTPGYQAPELLMTDMSQAERDHELYAKVDVFALGCTLFFLCVGKELFGATPGNDGANEFGARTKTKARAQLAQEMMDDALENSPAALTNIESVESGVEEGMVVRRRAPSDATAPEPNVGKNFAAAALARALGGAAERAELESRETEAELDVLMLKSMAEFPGYEPRTPEEVAFVERTYGAPAPPAPPVHRESLAAFVNRKVTPRQPPGFASLIGACLARDPEDRPSAADALNWPGAWVELDDEA